MHITEKQIALLLEKRLPEDERRKITVHMADCPDCAENIASAFKVFNSLDMIDLPGDDKVIKERGEAFSAGNIIGTLRKNLPLKFALTGIVLVFAFIIYYSLNHEPEISKLRSGDSTYSIISLQPDDGSVLNSSNLNFKWTSVPGSMAYRFLLYEENGTPITNSLLQDTSFTLHYSILKPESKYLWRIEIIFPDETKQRSELNVFIYSK